MSARHRLRATVLVALAATVALHAAGSGTLATPPLGSWSELDAWYLRSGTAVAVVALVRLVAFGAGCWLVLVGGLQLFAPLIAVDRFSALVDRISPRFLRAVSRSAAGLSISAGLALPVLPSAAADDPPGTAVMVPLDVPPSPPSSTTTSTAPTPSTTTTTLPPTTLPPTTVVPPAPEPPPPAAEVVAPEVLHDEVVVAPGDSFWSIAVDEAGERELVGYWRALIAANRDRLVDGSNPDLVYPGQVLRLP